MLARLMITESVPPLKTHDKVYQALSWMEEFKVRHLPIVNHEQLLGTVSEQDLMDSEDEDLPIGDLRISFGANVCVTPDDHVFDIIRILSNNRLDILPVVDSDQVYQGLIRLDDVVAKLSDILGVNEPGGIIVLEVPAMDYAPSLIARICESADARIMSLTVTRTPESSQYLVSIKLNISELSAVIAAFQHFNFTIHLAAFDRSQINDYRDNFEAFMRFLDI